LKEASDNFLRDDTMFVQGKDRHTLDRLSMLFCGVFMGCTLSHERLDQYVGLGFLAVSMLLGIAAWVARRRAGPEPM
jgi:hypothetical protein